MSNWEERFDERFKLEPYEPRDRTTEQVRQIINDDYAGEIVSDYVEERERGSREAFNQWLEDEMKPFIEEEMRTLLDTLLLEVETEREKSVNSPGVEPDYDAPYTASWYAGKGVAYKKVENQIKKLLEEMNHENGIK